MYQLTGEKQYTLEVKINKWEKNCPCPQKQRYEQVAPAVLRKTWSQVQLKPKNTAQFYVRGQVFSGNLAYYSSPKHLSCSCLGLVSHANMTYILVLVPTADLRFLRPVAPVWSCPSHLSYHLARLRPLCKFTKTKLVLLNCASGPVSKKAVPWW